MKKKLSIYVHIPFCVRKCAYCDFLSAPAEESVRASYVEALCRQIEREAASYADYSVETVFFGGGTPTVLKSDAWDKILCKLKSQFDISQDAEITMECNPGTVTEEELLFLRKQGVNRLSIGLQSARNEELRLLGRIHSYEAFLDTYQAARKVGFDRINVDVMAALPGQSLSQYEETLKAVLTLENPPEHISAYSLIIEEGTPFYEKYHEADEERRKTGSASGLLLPGEELERSMYERTKSLLSAHGYDRYEISNYAKTGYACRHNSVYWTRGEYLGLGLGAASLIQNTRYKVTSNLHEYLTANETVYEETEVLSKEDCMEEFMYLGLRMMEGVCRDDFYRQFGVSIESVYESVLRKLCNDGLLEETERGYKLTDYGIDVSNVVLSEFLL